MTTLKVGQKVRCAWGVEAITEVHEETGRAWVQLPKRRLLVANKGALLFPWALDEGSQDVVAEAPKVGQVRRVWGVGPRDFLDIRLTDQHETGGWWHGVQVGGRDAGKTWTFLKVEDFPVVEQGACCCCERTGFPADRYVSHGTENCTTGPYYEGKPCPPRAGLAPVADTRCHCEREGYPAGRYDFHGTGNCSYSEGNVRGTPCLPRVAPKGAKGPNCSLCQDTGLAFVASVQKAGACPECVDCGWVDAIQACAALRAKLPKSEQMYLEGSIGENEPAEQAIHEVRRQVASMREWPCCPVSKEPLRIEAKVTKESRTDVSFDGRRCREVMNTWHAEFTCDCCGRGGK